MRNGKKTKHSLLMSALSLLLCVSMLIGTTYAWFTDAVVSGMNEIIAGNLDVALLADGKEVDANTKLFDDVTLWEPGVVVYENLQIANKGSLALKWQMAMNFGSENHLEGHKLSQVLKVAVIDKIENTDRATVLAAAKAASATSLYNFYMSGSLEAEKVSEEQGVVIFWEPGENDNLYNANNGKTTSDGEPLHIEFGVKLVATQEMSDSEKDSFGFDYDSDALFPELRGGSVTASVPVENGYTTRETKIEGEGFSATVPAGVKVKDGVSTLTLSILEKDFSEANLTLEEFQELRPLDVHIEGVAADNDQAILVTIERVMTKGLNMGNYTLYHVENGTANPMTLTATPANHNDFHYEPTTGDVVLALKSFSEVALVAEEAQWEGSVDHSWYTDKSSPYTIANADQLWSFSQIVGGMATGIEQDSFKDKTVKLISDVNLGDKESENNSNLIFYPIGYYNSEGTYERTNTAITSGLRNFEGTFDGNGHTVSNFYHNTWEMKGDHDWYSPAEQYYRDGMGLFGRVYKGTVKNLTVKNFSSDGEIATTGVIAAYADGATFENIAIFNCNPRVYNIGNGGIVGCVGWYAKDAGLTTTFKNITVDNSNKISALWGSYDVPCGGIVGQYYPTSGQTSAGTPQNAGIELVNCHVSAQMDVYNDVCANYQYYAYRYAGMLIGSVRENETIDGHVYPKMDGITAKECTVHFGTWNDYYYCEIIDNTTASYTHDYQMSRLTEIKAINGTTITYLDGTTGTVPASGRANYVIVDYTKGHGTENATCYHFKDGEVWTHDMGGIQTGIDENGDGKDDLKEDKQHIYLEFNNLVTGYGWGVTSKGVDDVKGVEILDKTLDGSSVEKFVKVDTVEENYTTGRTVFIGDLFKAAVIGDKNLSIRNASVTVAVSPVGEDSTAGGTYTANTTDWTKGTLTFSGTGAATVTITDYYFCTPTTINVTITDRQPEEKFDVVMNNGDFLHRVGNVGTVALDKLFKKKDNVTVGTVSVTIEAVDGTAASGTYSNNAIQFNGTGVVKVTIKDDDKYCTPTELFLEVVDATNVTKATSATANNVVLLNDCGLSSLEVSGGYALYGNGFTMTYTGDGQYLGAGSGFKFGVINVSSGGKLDNCRIDSSVYPIAALYSDQIKNYYVTEGTKTRYFYQLSAVAVSGDSSISNCYIYGGRNNVYVGSGNVVIENSVLESGTLSNIQIVSSSEYTVSLNAVTTIQKQVKPTIYANDSLKNNVMLGFGVIVGDGEDTTMNPTIVLNGEVKQYNWVSAKDKDAVTDSYAKSAIDAALSNSKYVHNKNGQNVANLGIVILNTKDITITNNTDLPYVTGTILVSNKQGQVCSLQGAKDDQVLVDPSSAERSTKNAYYEPQFKYSNDLGGQHVPDEGGDEHFYREGDTIKVMFPTGKSKTLNLAGLVDISKYTGQNLSLKISCVDEKGDNVAVTDGKVSLSEAGKYFVTYSVTDSLFFDKDGNPVNKSPVDYSWNVTIDVSLKETAIPNAYFEFDSSVQKIFRSGNSNIVQFIPFLSGLKIHDYDENGNKYLRFDGGNTGNTTDYGKIVSATINNVNTTGEAQGYHIVTIELEDGGKIVIDMDVRANSGSSKHSGSIKVRNNVIYVVNDGTTSGKGQTWKIYSYKFVGNNGTEINSGLITFGTAGKDCDTANKPTSNFGSSSGGSGGDGSCLAAGTMITLVDGSKKAIENLRKGDMVMSFDHLNGTMTANEVIIVVKTHADSYFKNTFVFDDGTELVTINEHGVYDLDLNKYVNIDHLNYQTFIGHRFVSVNSEGKLGVKRLVAVETVQEAGFKYDIVTNETLNYVAEDTLSVTHVLVDVINSFDFGEDLKYDLEKMQADIAKYGLYTYDEWEEYCDISVFEQYNIPVMKVGISKGLYSKEYIVGLINTYVLDESVQII